MAKLLSLKLDKDWEKFEKELAELSRTFTGSELQQLERLSSENFLHEVTAVAKLDYDKKKILASLLFEKMQMYSETAQAEAYNAAREKCFLLYEHLAGDLTQNEYDLEVNYKLQFLKNPD